MNLRNNKESNLLKYFLDLKKTDIELIAKASATSAVSGGFELILEKVDQS